MRVDPHTQAHTESAAPSEETDPEHEPEPDSDPLGASDALVEEEPVLGTYDDGRFEPL